MSELSLSLSLLVYGLYYPTPHLLLYPSADFSGAQVRELSKKAKMRHSLHTHKKFPLNMVEGSKGITKLKVGKEKERRRGWGRVR